MPHMTHNPLEPFKEVLKRQKPEITGEPYVMECFHNSLPKSIGDPWIGAYSKHGFWYKFHEGNKDDFDKLVASSFEQDKYMLNYDYLNVWKNAYGEENVRVLVAKSLKENIMGGVVAIMKKKYAHIGLYFVDEDYRHSGIGSKLFREITLGSMVAFQAMHHLLSTIPNFGITARLDRRFNHVKLNCPSGFPNLKANLENYRVVLNDNLSDSEWTAITVFDGDVSGEQRPIRAILNLETSTTAAVFDEKENCVGFGTSRELAGGFVRRIVVGPLYAKSADIAELLTRNVLKKYYNPEEDYDFDPDCFAIYRREVEFILPAEEKMMSIIEKLQGDDGKLTRERLWYQTCTSFPLPESLFDFVYAAGDLHSMLV